MPKIGLVTDIHANTEALDAILSALDREKIDHLVCLGDIVGYGAEPAGCVSRIRKHARVSILGNHDAAVAGKMDLRYYHDEVASVFPKHRKQLGQEDLAWLAERPYEVLDADASAAYCHGNPGYPEAFGYLLQPLGASLAADQRPDLAHLRAVFFGHSHLPRCFEVAPDRTATNLARDGLVQLREGYRYFVSVPSVGQPRDYDPRAGAVVYDADAGTLEFLRVEYDVDRAAQKILEAGNPSEYAYRLYRGI